MTIDPRTGRVEQRGSPQRFGVATALSDGRFAVLGPGTLTLLDLTASRALVLALPVPPKGTRRTLAAGGLATLSRGKGDGAPSDITVYQLPD